MALELPDTAFWNAYQGPFSGILSWPDFDALWVDLETAPEGWYVFDLKNTAPNTPADAKAFRQVLTLSKDMYVPVRKRSFCGTVYVDNSTAPRFVKVFDPYKMGSACGCSGERILPRFVFSKIQPDALPNPEPIAKPGFFARITGRKQVPS